MELDAKMIGIEKKSGDCGGSRGWKKGVIGLAVGAVERWVCSFDMKAKMGIVRELGSLGK
jgi:hypothetical protein